MNILPTAEFVPTYCIGGQSSKPGQQREPIYQRIFSAHPLHTSSADHSFAPACGVDKETRQSLNATPIFLLLVNLSASLPVHVGGVKEISPCHEHKQIPKKSCKESSHRSNAGKCNLMIFIVSFFFLAKNRLLRKNIRHKSNRCFK